MSKKIALFSLIALVLALSLFTASFYGCNDSPVSPRETVSYSQDIQQIFTSSCSFPAGISISPGLGN